MKLSPAFLPTAFFLILASASIASAQEQFVLNVRYVCNGERLVIENCNIRDTSDAGTCLVAHPDRPSTTGFPVYTNEKRGDLKKLIPTCKQPSADELAHRKAADEKFQAMRTADENKAKAQLAGVGTQEQQFNGGKPQTAEQRAIARCISAGRPQMVCLGRGLADSFGAFVGQIVPAAAPTVTPGLYMNGVYGGPGSWRVDFGPKAAATKCADLVPESHPYNIDLRNNQAFVTLQNSPKSIVLALKPDGTVLSGAGPVTVNGRIVIGYAGGGAAPAAGAPQMQTQQVTTNRELTPLEARQYEGSSNLSQNGQVYNLNETHSETTWSTPMASSPPPAEPIYKAKTASCPAPNISSKPAAPGATSQAQDMVMGLLSAVTGPESPSGLRMEGSYVDPSGAALEFFPESVIVSCGEAARAYPYVVQVNGSQALVKVQDAAHPLLFSVRSSKQLSTDAGAVEVHGRRIIGDSGNGDFTYAPLNATCKFSNLTAGPVPAPSAVQTLPASNAPPSAAASSAPAGSHAAAPSSPAPSAAKPALPLATAAKPTGDAVLTITAAFRLQPGEQSFLAGRPYMILRDTLANIFQRANLAMPDGMSPLKALGTACGTQSPDCMKYLQAISREAASLAAADATGKATLPGVPAGTYYLMISGAHNQKPYYWDFKVDLKSGPNAVALDIYNATAVR